MGFSERNYFQWCGEWLYVDTAINNINLCSTGSGSNRLRYYTNIVIKDDSKENKAALKKVIKGMSNKDFSRQLIQLSPSSEVKLSILEQLLKEGL